MTVKQLLEAGVKRYVGRNVTYVEVIPDLKVNDTYAIRAWLDEEETIDFLLYEGWRVNTMKMPCIDDVTSNLVEAEFISWPDI